MSSRITLQPAYVLHTQPFQNTSLLVDFFSLDFGRIKAIAKGARRPRSRTRSLLQPFQPLLLSLSGRHELKTVTGVEGSVASLDLKGIRLFSGLYLNELLVRLLLPYEDHPSLYSSYQNTLLALKNEGTESPELMEVIGRVLRRFELDLLKELGYGIDLYRECHTGVSIQAEARYLFHPDIGFEKFEAVSASDRNPFIFQGSDLISLRELDLGDKVSSDAAKRLLRLALQVHLGEKPLSSRELFSGAGRN